VNGLPVAIFVIQLNCQPPTTRDTIPLLLFSSQRPGPNGSSNVPFTEF
jgi:hypothetical protein